MRFVEMAKQLLIPNKRLSQKAISSGIWLGASRIANRTLSLVRTVILARILAPHDFGLFGIALIVLSALQNFSQPGTGEALIQSQKSEKIYLDVAWTIKVIRGIVLAIILIAIAPIAAKFFKEPKTTYLMYIVGASLIFGGFGNQGVIHFIKDLNFHKQFIYEFTSTITEFIVSIILVFILKDSFALAYGYLAGVIALSVTSYFMHSYRPRFVINISIAKELTKFGRWIWGYSMLDFLLNQGIGLFIGKVLGATLLGVYQMSLKLTGAIITEVGTIFSNVGFPLYSKLQDDKHKLCEAYSKSLKINSFFIIPLALFLFIFAKEITNVLLGMKWNEAVPIIKIVVIYGALKSFSSINGAILKALGYPSIITKTQIMRLLCLIILVFHVSLKWRLTGVALLVTIVELFMVPIEFFITTRKINFSYLSLIKIISIPLLTSFMAIITVSYFNSWIFIKNTNVIVLVFAGIMSLLIYGVVLYLIDLKMQFGLRRVFSKNYFLALLGN